MFSVSKLTQSETITPPPTSQHPRSLSIDIVAALICEVVTVGDPLKYIVVQLKNVETKVTHDLLKHNLSEPSH